MKTTKSQIESHWMKVLGSSEAAAFRVAEKFNLSFASLAYEDEPDYAATVAVHYEKVALTKVDSVIGKKATFFFHL